MIPHRCIALATLALPAPAIAQFITPDSAATFALAWQELDSAYQPVPNPNGLLEPGERAWLKLTASFTNQGTIGTFYGPIQQPTFGTISGFGAGFIDLNGTNSGPGSWEVDPAHGFGPDPLWTLAGYGGWGTPASGGADLRSIQFFQFPSTPGAINTTNPVTNIWTGVWTPASYVLRDVTFQSAAGTGSGGFGASVLFRLSPTMLASAFCQEVNYGSVQIPIVPAPASFLCSATLLLCSSRRRAVRSHSS